MVMPVNEYVYNSHFLYFGGELCGPFRNKKMDAQEAEFLLKTRPFRFRAQWIRRTDDVDDTCENYKMYLQPHKGIIFVVDLEED